MFHRCLNKIVYLKCLTHVLTNSIIIIDLDVSVLAVSSAAAFVVFVTTVTNGLHQQPGFLIDLIGLIGKKV